MPESFPVYQAVEWQCRFVFEDKRCCGLKIGHQGDHIPALVRAGGVERTPEPRLERLAKWNDRLELAVYGKVGNTFERGQSERIEAFLNRIVDLEARGAVETPAQEPEHEAPAVHHHCSGPSWCRKVKTWPADGAAQQFDYECVGCGIKITVNVGEFKLRSARPNPPPATPQESQI